MKVFFKQKIDLYSKQLYFLTVISLFLVCVMVFINIYLLGHDKTKVDFDLFLNSEITECSINKWQVFNVDFQKLESNKIIYKAYDINIYPEINNFYCLGKIIKIENSSNLTEVTIGTNRFVFKFFNLIINFSLIILLLGKVLKVKYICVLYVLFNCYNFYLFRSDLTIIKSIFPFTDPQTYDEIYIFNIVLLSLIVDKSKVEKIKLFYIYALVFFIPDYLGLFVIFLFFFNKNFIDLNNKVNQRILSLLPVSFYLLRTIYSLNSYFDHLWMLTGQRVYHGVSRYYDALWNFEAMACIRNPNIFDNINKQCRELYGGILDNYIFITSDPYVTSLIFMSIMHLLIVLIYFDTRKRFKFNQLYVTLLIVSPPFNFLTFQGNLDILYFVLSYFLLTKMKKYDFAIALIFFILSLYKLHALGAIAGLIVYSVLKNNRKYVLINLSFFVISFYFALSQILDNQIVYGFGRFEYSYGLMNISNLVYSLLGIREYFVLTFLLLIIIFLLKTYMKYENFGLYDKHYESELSINVYTYWFLFTLFTINNSYRLPIFYVLLLTYLNSSNSFLKLSTAVFIFLSVIPITNYLIFIYLFGLIKYSSMIILVTLIVLFEYEKISKFLKKTINIR